MQIDLENKKVFITGASGGIGKILSEKFIESGAKLILTSSNEIPIFEQRFAIKLAF